MDWLLYRPVLAGCCTFIEANEQMTLVELLELNIALDIKADAEELERRRAKK